MHLHTLNCNFKDKTYSPELNTNLPSVTPGPDLIGIFLKSASELPNIGFILKLTSIICSRANLARQGQEELLYVVAPHCHWNIGGTDNKLK